MARCGAIISIPSWRNSSSSEDVMDLYAFGGARAWLLPRSSWCCRNSQHENRMDTSPLFQANSSATLSFCWVKDGKLSVSYQGSGCAYGKVSPVDVGPAHARRKDYKRAQFEHLFQNLPRPSSSAPSSNRERSSNRRGTMRPNHLRHGSPGPIEEK